MSGSVSASDRVGERGASSGRAAWTCFKGEDWGGELERSVENFLRFRGRDEVISSRSLERNSSAVSKPLDQRLAPFLVISRSCLEALLWRPPLVERELRGVKNLVKRFGVTVGGFFIFWLLKMVFDLVGGGPSGEEAFSFSMGIWYFS